MTQKNFPALLKEFQSEIARALPRHINADRMARIALTEFRRNPKLAQCEPKSIFASVIMGSQLGLEPGVLGQCYLVPYKGECQLIPGWQGLYSLVARAGQASAWTGAVFEGDDFAWEMGDSPHITHKPKGENDPHKLTHAYAVGRIKGSDWPICEVWPAERIRNHRDRYNKVGKAHYSYQHWEMYARKVVLLQVLKYLPKSTELSSAMELEYASETGRQGLDLGSAVEGTWVPEATEVASPEQEPSLTEQVKRAQPPQREPTDWPRKNDQGIWYVVTEDGEQEVYDPKIHSSGKDEQGRPLLTKSGRFRRARGSGTASPAPKIADVPWVEDEPTPPVESKPIEQPIQQADTRVKNFEELKESIKTAQTEEDIDLVYSLANDSKDRQVITAEQRQFIIDAAVQRYAQLSA